LIGAARKRGRRSIGAKISTFRVPDAVQRERSEAVRRCSGTFTKVVCVTIHAGRVYPTCVHLSADLGQARDRCLQRTTRLRLALRCARDTPVILVPMGRRSHAAPVSRNGPTATPRTPARSIACRTISTPTRACPWTRVLWGRTARGAFLGCERPAEVRADASSTGLGRRRSW